MANNKVEYHIQHTAFFTFAVKAGEKMVAGDIVKITGDFEVGKATRGDRAIGVVYAGTVGESEYDGDKNHKVTVVINKPFVYLTVAAGVAAGDLLAPRDEKKVATHDGGTSDLAAPFAQAVTSAVANNDVIVAVLL